ncbi:MAG: C-GCAxxG-C-C family protein [Candidatus Atribacteria bacterium]|nr:C-GCAxxG-C-C family protein [Candidatus Atribacteria bacterium]
MKSRTEIAISKFLGGYNCAQSVFYSFCDDLQFDKNTALKLACGFGAGMGRKEEVCGAVTGGILVIGAKYGRDEKSDRTSTEAT